VCIHRGVRCDGNFSAADFDRLGREKMKLEQACQDALDKAACEVVEAASLNRRITALNKVRGAMIEYKSASLIELE
jgi:hypothetical protein